MGRPLGSHLHPHPAADGDRRTWTSSWSAEGKNLKGRLLEILVATGGKRFLDKALGNTVKAIEARVRARWIGVSMNELSTVTLIRRPVEDVFAALMDITRTPLWWSG